ncbi:hypothetical protein D6833_06260, partial [Candidatus Parcubacteria bacterium]
LLTSRSARGLVRPLFQKAMPARLEAALRKLFYCMHRYARAPWLVLRALILAILTQGLRVLLYSVASVALGQDVPFLFFAVFIPIIMFVSMLPFSLGGLGVREAGFVYFFSSYGLIDADGAFALSLLVFVATLLSTIPGAYSWVRISGRTNPVT